MLLWFSYSVLSWILLSLLFDSPWPIYSHSFWIFYVSSSQSSTVNHQSKWTEMGDWRIFQNHENRIPGKTGISFQRRQNTGTLSDLLSVTDDLSDTWKEAGRKIHGRKDHNNTKKNGIAYNSRNGISAFLYKNWSYW